MERTRREPIPRRALPLVLMALALAGCWRDVNPTSSVVADVVSSVDGAVDTAPSADASDACALADGGTCPRGTTCIADCRACSCSRSGVLSCVYLELCAPIDAGPPTCTTDADCPTGDVCAYLQPGCAEHGICQPIVACDPPVGLDYCGCDGVSHPVATCNPPPMPYTSREACPGADCDFHRVRCDLAPPMCPAGMIPSVGPGECWSGLCVPYAACACGPGVPCPGGLQCASGMCGSAP